ncbi:MAG: MarR family transcriptional regulator [Pseudobdellovibrio sp.]|jgi:DNA-binding MarR family transcriptional regulator|nr:MarR family transcriptional regulator [Pseudobdellovibrio sp.]
MNAKKVSSEIIEVIPTVMRTIRSEMRKVALPEMTIAQFRILMRLDHGCQSNKQLAEWVGISTAAMSRTIEVLVVKGYVQRKSAESDRREVILALTAQGKKKYEAIKEMAKLTLTPRLDELNGAELKKVHEALLILMEVFGAKQ